MNVIQEVSGHASVSVLMDIFEEAVLSPQGCADGIVLSGFDFQMSVDEDVQCLF